MRQSGILLPVFSLPSPYGIGCFSDEAKKFIDFLSGSGQSYWQILPLGPTSFGNSPYQSPSSFAGNPYFIDIETLKNDGLLTRQEADDYKNICPTTNKVDYGFLYETRHKILKLAFKRFSPPNDYYRFIGEESYWLKDYAEFCAIKDRFGGKDFLSWDNEFKYRQNNRLSQEILNEAEYYKFLQYEFMKQWTDIKSYANRRGIKIIGDMPIYTAMDSADTWSHPELFKLDKNLYPVSVAGCPPDKFSPRGQLWGNPVYNWENHKKDGYAWWSERMKRNMRLYDTVRIDHFRGFESYYSIPYGAKDATSGKWIKGPGKDIFETFESTCPNLDIIAEDLGFVTDDVRELLSATGYPGMKVLLFAFDSCEDNDYLPHNYSKNCVVYTGTHDNSTVKGFEEEGESKDVLYAKKYIGCDNLCKGMVRLAMSSVAKTCIIPLQDYLGLDNSARINTPSTLGGNWTWRMSKISESTEKEIYDITVLYGRNRRD